MSGFNLKKICSKNIEKELASIGFESSYIAQGAQKYKYQNIKIFGLTLPQANILKQTALSVGADCAVHRDILTAQIKFSDCILGGSFSQIKKIAEKLKFQPFSMKNLANELENLIFENTKIFPKIFGILNVTKNSFSDGGKFYDYEMAIEHLNKLIQNGADVIDIGAESTKPFSHGVTAEEQLKVLEPILNYINEHNITVPISIDTRSSVVAKRVIELGVSVINDVSGLEYDVDMINVCAKSNVNLIIQHSQGSPESMQINPHYQNLVDDIFNSLKRKIEFAEQNGIEKKRIIIDLGIGFGKTREQNFELLARVDEFKSLGCKVMLGTSRKSLLNMQEADNDEKDVFTLVLNTIALENNVDYLRVHNVELNKKLLSLYEAYAEAIMN